MLHCALSHRNGNSGETWNIQCSASTRFCFDSLSVSHYIQFGSLLNCVLLVVLADCPFIRMIKGLSFCCAHFKYELLQLEYNEIVNRDDNNTFIVCVGKKCIHSRADCITK